MKCPVEQYLSLHVNSSPFLEEDFHHFLMALETRHYQCCVSILEWKKISWMNGKNICELMTARAVQTPREPVSYLREKY